MSGLSEREMITELINNCRIEVTLKDSGNCLALVNLILGEVLQIRGWRISNSKWEENPFWVQPPSYGRSKAGKSYYAWWLTDQELSATIVVKIIEAYENRKMDEDEENITF